MTRRFALAVLVAAVAAQVATVTASTAAPPAPTASSTASPTRDAHAGEAWWVPVGLRGTRVSSIGAAGDRLVVGTDHGTMLSTDGGATFTAGAPGVPPATADPGVDAEAVSGGDRWALRAGRVLHAAGAGPLLADPGAPDLGTGARLIAAPAALPGQVVVVSDAGVVWRRAADGTWGRTLLLLPSTLIGGRPDITAVSAFSDPVTTGVYLATDGYSVLLSTDGGEDWLRGGPGLPDAVLALASDSAGRAVFAGTADGLWVHHLRVLPSVPVYSGPDLTNRRLGTAAITLAGVAAAMGLLIAGLPRRRVLP